MAIVPAWSDWLYKNAGPGPHPFDAKNARTFGEYVGQRYKNNDIIWVIGGDRAPAGYEDILQAMVAGLDEGGDDRDFLMTFHGMKIGKPIPPENVYQERLCSSHLFGAADWLDFHGAYSGHQWAYPTYRLTALDRAMNPTRPVIDLEPCYENHAYHADGSNYWENPNKWDGKTRGTAALIREQGYWALLAGAAGHRYAANDVWQFHESGPAAGGASFRPNTPWRTAMEFPGARQMGIMRRLFESRAWQTLEPDQRIIASGQGKGENHIQAARSSDGKFLFVYLPRGSATAIDMTKINGQEALAHWFNPRDGEATSIGRFPCSNKRKFSPPSQGVDNDWVLILDEATQDFSIPGAPTRARPK